jgi:hypothetical protein
LPHFQPPHIINDFKFFNLSFFAFKRESLSFENVIVVNVDLVCCRPHGNLEKLSLIFHVFETGTG